MDSGKRFVRSFNEYPMMKGEWRILWLLLLATLSPSVALGSVPLQGKVCCAHLKEVDGAIQQWALKNKKTGTHLVPLGDPEMLQYFRGSRFPVCPAGGTYVAKAVADEPVCTVHGTIKNAADWDRRATHGSDLKRALIIAVLGAVFLVPAGLRLRRPAAERGWLVLALPWIFFVPGFALCLPEFLPPGNHWTFAHPLGGWIFGVVGVLLCAVALTSPSRSARLGAWFMFLLYSIKLSHSVVVTGDVMKY
jgi:hypothetical protein